MTIDTTTAALFLTILGYAVTLTIWLSRLGARVESMERWQDEHGSMRERMAKLEASNHELRNAVQTLVLEIRELRKVSPHPAE